MASWYRWFESLPLRWYVVTSAVATLLGLLSLVLNFTAPGAERRQTPTVVYAYDAEDLKSLVRELRQLKREVRDARDAVADRASELRFCGAKVTSVSAKLSLTKQEKTAPPAGGQ